MRNGRGLKRGRSRTDKRIRTEVTEERPEVTERRTEVTEGAIVRLNGAMIGRTAIGAIGRKVIDRAATGHSVQKATGPSDRVVSTEVIDRKVIGRSSREASTAEIGHAVIGAIEKKATDLTETDHSARRAIAHSSRAVSGGTGVTEEEPGVAERRAERTEDVMSVPAAIGATGVTEEGPEVAERRAAAATDHTAIAHSNREVSTEEIVRTVTGRSVRRVTARSSRVVSGGTGVTEEGPEVAERRAEAVTDRTAIAHSSRVASGGTGVTEEGPEVVERRAEATDRSVQKVIVRSDRRVIDRSNRAVNTVAIDRKVSVGSTSRVVIGRFGPGVIGRSSRVKVGAAVAGAETIAVAVRAAVVVRGNQRSETKNRSYLAAFRSASAVSPGPTRTR